MMALVIETLPGFYLGAPLEFLASSFLLQCKK
jgi:hypothetical protein